MSEVGSLNVDLILNSASFAEGAAKAKAAMSAFEKSVKPVVREFNKFGKGMEKAGESLSKNLTLPILAAGAAIGVAVSKMASYGSEINDMSVRTGFSRESLQELKFAADQTGVSMESIEVSTRRLTKSMGEAAAGQGSSAKLFEQLGISIKNADGTLRPANEVFNETIGALGRIPDETTRNVVAMDLLGKSAGDLTPLMEAGETGLSDFAKEARDAGLVMSEEAIIAADAFGDKMDKLKAQLGLAGMEIGQAFMPVMEKMIAFIQDSVVPAIKQFSEWFKNLSTTQKEWIVGIAAALAVLGPLAVLIGKTAKGIGTMITGVSKLKDVLTGVGAASMITAGAIAALGAIIISAVDWSGGWSNLWDDMKADMANFADQAHAMGILIGGVLTGNLQQIEKGWQDYKKTQVDAMAATTVRIMRHNLALEEAKKAQEELTKVITPPEVKNEPIIISLEKESDKVKNLTQSYTDLSFMKDKIGAVAFDAGVILRAQVDFAEPRKEILNFTNEFKRSMETNPPVLAPPNQELFKKGMTNMQLVFAMTTDSMGEQWSKMIEKISEKSKKIVSAVQQLSGMITDIFSQSIKNQEIELDNRYKHEREQLEASVAFSRMTEEQRGEAMKKLNTKFDKERAVLLTKKAKADKASALITATVNTAAAVTAALEFPPLAVAIAALGAIQIGLIASQPIPQFAEGGLVFDETLSMVGEGRNTSRSNPEVIAPLDKLMDFFAPQQSSAGGEVIFTIHGETLRGVLLRNERSRKFLANG